MKANQGHYRTILLSGLASAAMLIGLPLAGAAVAGHPLAVYLEFPPMTRHVVHAGFSWIAFALFAAINLLMLAGMGHLLWQAFQRTRGAPARRIRPFPRWGWIGLGVMIGGWTLAWRRFEWFAVLQGHTFSLPWIGYIILVNALCLRRSGHSTLTAGPGRFLLLFPVSALFWWFFEYLNRFVQNWYYVGPVDFGPAAYTLFASLAFATVLPAVLSTYHLLLTFKIFGRGLYGQVAIQAPVRGTGVAKIGLGLAGSGLFLIGLIPDVLFALVWVAPLLIITCMETLTGRTTLFSFPASGDWRPIVTAAAAALICGFFWEMWNIGSLARWEYAIPFVDRFHIFAMPVLGYGGYLPFGLECMVICRWIIPDGLTPTLQH